MVLLRSGRARRPRVDGGFDRRVLDVPVAHDDGVLACAQRHRVGGLVEDLQHLLPAELDQPLGGLAVDAHLDEEFQSSLKDAVGQVVVGGNEVLRIVFDAVGFDQLSNPFGEGDLEIGLFHVGPCMGPAHNLH